MNIKHIFKNNKKWVQEQLNKAQKNFTSLSEHQHSSYLKKNANLTIRGWIYSLDDGILHDIRIDKNTI